MKKKIKLLNKILLLTTTTFLCFFLIKKYNEVQKKSLINIMQEPKVLPKHHNNSCNQPMPTQEAIKENVIEVTTINMIQDIQNNPHPVVIKFYANWCGPCMQLKPIFKKIASDYDKKITFYAINVDEKELLEEAEKKGLLQESIVYLPTTVFYYKKPIEQLVGNISEKELTEKINTLFSTIH